MNRMEDAKKKYDEVPIPEELSERIQWEVQKADSRRRKPEAEETSVWLAEGACSCGRGHGCFRNGFEYQYGICPEHGRTSGDRSDSEGAYLPFL